nr:hypothetical protein CFP56_57222 [Quercus suber]
MHIYISRGGTIEPNIFEEEALKKSKLRYIEKQHKCGQKKRNAVVVAEEARNKVAVAEEVENEVAVVEVTRNEAADCQQLLRRPEMKCWKKLLQ